MPGVSHRIPGVRVVKSISVESPGADEDLSMFFASRAMTVIEMNCVLVGSSTPSVTWTVRHAADRSAAGSEVLTSGTSTTNTTSGEKITSFNDPTIAANSHVWIETTAQSGAVTSIVITIIAEED